MSEQSWPLTPWKRNASFHDVILPDIYEMLPWLDFDLLGYDREHQNLICAKFKEILPRLSGDSRLLGIWQTGGETHKAAVAITRGKA